jgi:hypothetical protein
MTPLVCIFSLAVLVSCLRMQLSHQANRQAPTRRAPRRTPPTTLGSPSARFPCPRVDPRYLADDARSADAAP